MQELVNEIKQWMKEAADQIKVALTEEVFVDTKTDRKDLVTNVDKMTQDFLISKMKQFDPEAKILGEENNLDSLSDFSGRVFIIDPIDGTMNFVLEQQHFCIMIAVYQDGIGQLGFIYDVMGERFLHGGPTMGIYLNDERIASPENRSLSEGLLGMNAVMYARNRFNAQLMGEHALGVRVSGCAGIELIEMILGNRVGYVSNLSPWDYAAGGVLLDTLGMKMSGIYGESLKFSGREYFIAGTQQTYQELLDLALQSRLSE